MSVEISKKQATLQAAMTLVDRTFAALDSRWQQGADKLKAWIWHGYGMDMAMSGYGCTVHQAEIHGVSGHQQGDFRASHHSDESTQEGQETSVLSSPRGAVTA